MLGGFLKIAIIGLGYVGTVTGSTLVTLGHDVQLVDKDLNKVEILNSGISPIAEPGLAESVRSGVDSGRLRATVDVSEAANWADFVIVSVGTPTDPDTGEVDLSAVLAVSRSIAETLPTRAGSLLVAISSTVPPGTTEERIRPILAAAAPEPEKFSLAFIPEFLREASAISDFLEPTRFVIGARDQAEAAKFKVLRPDLGDRTYLVDTGVAEMLKTTENCWHATKVTFANEVGRICASLDVDARQVMDILLRDTKQNVSAAYMRPGFAYGGSCLPKDLRSMVRLGQAGGVSTPMLAGVGPSNRQHVDSAVNAIQRLGLPKIGVLGLAFKADTDDMRESPAVDLVEALLGRGFDVRIHDFHVNRTQLFGSNLAVWSRHAHLAARMVESVDELIANSDVVVLAQHNRVYAKRLDEGNDDVIVIDLVGLT